MTNDLKFFELRSAEICNTLPNRVASNTRSVWCLMCVGLALTFTVAVTHAQTYPTKPIRLIVPFAPGGSTDVVARLVAQKLGESLSQQVIVENKPGNNGNIGTVIVAKAAPDGYTLLLAYDSTMTINPSAYTNLPFDSIKDFAPITKVASLPLMLVAHPSFAPNNLKELIALAKTKPGIDYASGGHGSTGHLTMLLMAQQAGIKMTHVSYKGAGQAMIDVIGGHVPLNISAIPAVQANLKSGKLKAIALTSAKRLASMPEVGTFNEAGVSGFDVSVWLGLMAPAGTPKPIITKLRDEVARILSSPEMKDRFTTVLGGDPGGGTPEQFATELEADIARWGEIVRSNGIRFE